jgi:hypothetical protein
MIYKPPKKVKNMNGSIIVQDKNNEDFIYLINRNVSDILLFDNGTDEDIEQGKIILPRHYFLFEGIKNGEIQFKPYEYNRYRIVISTFNNIIVYVMSIG